MTALLPASSRALAFWAPASSFREGYSVRGITTAATIWAAAAVGMAVARELYLVAVLGSVLIFILLEARPLTRRLDELIRRTGRDLGEEASELMVSQENPKERENDG